MSEAMGPSPEEMGLSEKDRERFGLGNEAQTPAGSERAEIVQAMEDIDAADALSQRLAEQRRAAEFESMGIEDPQALPKRERLVRAMDNIDRYNETGNKSETGQ